MLPFQRCLNEKEKGGIEPLLRACGPCPPPPSSPLRGAVGRGGGQPAVGAPWHTLRQGSFLRGCSGSRLGHLCKWGDVLQVAPSTKLMSLQGAWFAGPPNTQRQFAWQVPVLRALQRYPSPSFSLCGDLLQVSSRCTHARLGAMYPD